MPYKNANADADDVDSERRNERGPGADGPPAVEGDGGTAEGGGLRR